MTIRTLFIIILKVLGILSLKELILILTQFITIVASFFTGYGFDYGFFMLFVSLVALALSLAVCYFLIFKAEYLVDKLALDKGFQESTRSLNIQLASIFRIALMVTAFLILVWEIPEFIRIIISELQRHDVSLLGGGTDWPGAVASGAKIIIALLLIGERKRILDFLTPVVKTEGNT